MTLHTPSRARWFPSFFLALALAGSASAADEPFELPDGFVYLSEAAPRVRQSIRYLGVDNFLGRPVRGYEAPECILTEQAAEALALVAADLASEGLGLKVFDCYRPQRAVDDFVEWSRDLADQKTKPVFYSRVDKARLFELGYIASHSGHSRGSTVDLTMVRLDVPQSQRRPPAEPCYRPSAASRAPDELDFGTPWDCFDELSHTEHPAIEGEAAENRLRFVAAMARRGFRNYPREWWHFTLEDEPFPETFFDFPIQ
jgi:zinc D-Ala-D-Ala dipeptidase